VYVMRSLQSHELKRELTDFLTKKGAFKVKVADPQEGFEKTLEGCHPRDIMKDCRSVIVFAFNIGLDYYLSMDYQHNNIRLGHLYRDWAGLQLISFLRMKECDAKEVPLGFKDEDNKIAYMSFKVAAYEAGIGVFGRPGIIITPEYGPRVNLGVVLTDAKLEPDERMTDFNPCKDCSACVRICPVRAIEEHTPPPSGFKRDRCVKFVDWLRRETKDEVKACGYCYDHCPAGKLVKKTIKITRWKTPKNVNADLRRSLINAYLHSRRQPT